MWRNDHTRFIQIPPYRFSKPIWPVNDLLKYRPTRTRDVTKRFEEMKRLKRKLGEAAKP